MIDKVAIGNGMTGKYHFKFENYQALLDVLNGNTGVIMIGAHVGNWEIGAPFFDEYGKKINIVMFDAEHERIKEKMCIRDRHRATLYFSPQTIQIHTDYPPDNQ